MKKTLVALTCAGLVLLASAWAYRPQAVGAANEPNLSVFRVFPRQEPRPIYDNRFEVKVLVDGRPLEEYYGRGRVYIEALKGAEYEVRIRNPLPVRVAVALSVDGLNSIDARRTSAWNASKWVVGPGETITVGGWQMSSERARRFYFTDESDSYASRLGQTTNLGLISAVFFRERVSRPVTIVPPPQPRKEGRAEKQPDSPSASADKGASRDRTDMVVPRPDDEYAATGIGRSVHNDVRWIDMELEPHSVGEVAIRYEYYSALVRLGIVPRPYYRPEPLPRRERSTGFQDRRFSPEP